MHPLHPIFSLLILIIILVSVKTSGLFLKIKISEVKFTSIDGLRGYLAVFVFLHHSAIWFYYSAESKWQSPPSNLYNHFGQTSVILFFMITGFLFYTKLFDSSKKPIDWFNFYIARFLRLTPLYFLALVLMFLIVMILSDFKMVETPVVLFQKILVWLSYGVIDMPDLNNAENTRYILAWVTWSLVYEWLFYFILPFVALLSFHVKTSLEIILISLAGVVFILYNIGFNLMYILPFAGGVGAAIINQIDKLRALASSVICTIIALGCLLATIFIFESPYGIIPIAMLSLFFTIVANGNSIFGLLNLDISRVLGQISYTIYLLHGIILFTVFTFFVKTPCTTLEYWGIICGIAAVLVFISRLVYTYYEGPIIQSSPKITEYLKHKLKLTE